MSPARSEIAWPASRHIGRPLGMALLLGATTAALPATSWAGGWYLASPPDMGLSDTPITHGWQVIQPFETLTACEAELRRMSADALTAARKAGNAMDDADRVALWIMLNQDMSADHRKHASEHLQDASKEGHAGVRDAIAALLALTIARAGRCIASDDPRLR